MEQFKQFSIEKQTALDTLGRMEAVLDDLAALEIDTSVDRAKLRDAIAEVESDVLRIALLGAFSDGKTSVVAAWLGKIMDDMKIDMDESSDRVVAYQPEGLPVPCEIVDTPGLFGDKEKIVDGAAVMYEDLTKRYISRAHLVFYVVDAGNPLKDSHGEVARWVMRDLDKLSSTVFVINKMDAVTDLTEPAVFERQAAIKKDNLKLALQRAANLDAGELANLNIVCIAADPYGRGLDDWFTRPDDYAARSRIGEFKAITSRVLEGQLAQALIAKTGIDVVRDVVRQKLAFAQSELAQMAAIGQQNAQEATRIRQDIDSGKVEVRRLSRELAAELMAMEKQLQGQLRPLALEDLRPFLEDDIGYSSDDAGYKLQLRIKGAIDGLFDQASSVTGRISLDIQRQLDSSESFLDAMSEKAASTVGGALGRLSQLDPATVKDGIFTARDMLASVTGITVKFKPWEATRIAGAVTKWAGPAGAAISLASDGYKMYKAHELEQELSNVKGSIGDAIADAFKQILDLLRDEQRMFAFFAPQLGAFEVILATMTESAERNRVNQEALGRIQARLDTLLLPAGAHPL